MDITADDFRRHFELLSDAALLATNRDDLVETARECYDAEVSRRGLNAPETVAEEVSQQRASSQEGFVLVATYLVAEEANLARGLLQDAEIPSQIDVNYTLGPVELRLLVPEDLVEEALEILGSEISEEELAAQAEAAGVLEEEEEAE
jgi:hypothetical protein